MNRNETLSDMHNYIINNKWYGCESTLYDLIQFISPRDAIKIAVNQTASYLPIFEHYYRDVHWPRKFLVELGETGHLSSTFPIYEDEGNKLLSPGASPFFKALEFLESAVARTTNPDECLSRTASAIVEALAANRYYVWAASNPGDWELWINRAWRDIFEMKSKLLHGTEVDRYLKDKWSQIANQIERCWDKSDPLEVNIPEKVGIPSGLHQEVSSLPPPIPTVVNAVNYDPSEHLSSLIKAFSSDAEHIDLRRFKWALNQIIIQYLGSTVAIQVALSCLIRYLPIFESHHSDVGWPRHYLKSLAESDTNFEALPKAPEEAMEAKPDYTAESELIISAIRKLSSVPPQM